MVHKNIIKKRAYINITLKIKFKRKIHHGLTLPDIKNFCQKIDIKLKRYKIFLITIYTTKITINSKFSNFAII